MKIACVKPLFKKGCKQTSLTIRPISILSVISKIIENYLCQQIREHLELHDLSAKNQFRFRPNRCIKCANYEAFALKNLTNLFLIIMWPEGTNFLPIIFVEKERVTEPVPVD